MSDERELERHNKILEQIKNAQTREELPKVGFPTIASFLAINIYFNDRKISQTCFQPVIDALISCGFFAHPNVKKALFQVIAENYPDANEDDVIEKYYQLLDSKRIGYLLIEISEKNLKLDEIIKRENYEAHRLMVKDINDAYEVKDLPKVGLSELNRKLLRAVNDNDFATKIKTSEIKELTNAYLNHFSYEKIENVVDKLVSRYVSTESEKELMREQIMGSLIMDETIEYIVEEMALKEKRKLEIYKLNHEETMQYIKEANRISQLPPNLTISTVSSYLNGNTTIYPNDDRITSEDLKNLTDLLIDGYKWEDELIKNEVRKIVDTKYPDKTDAYGLLYDKLSNLPRTYYLIEEVKYSQERQVEFIGRGSSNVNVYFIPNNNSPIDGGRFYNCYINRIDNLDLSQILPLDLESIVPPEMDIDSVEWYVQEHADPTFKTAGGIILNRDESIGNVSVFRPNDGTVGVSPEEKEKMDQIDDLDAKIEEKRRLLDELDKEVSSKQEQSKNMEEQLQMIVSDYEQKALDLQAELIERISSAKQSLGMGSSNSDDKGRGIKLHE